MIASGKLYNAYLNSYRLDVSDLGVFYDCVADLYNTDEVRGLEKYEQHLDIDRLQHIISVAYLSFRICRRMGLDYRTAARGGILHDLFYYDWRENDWSHRPHGYRHPGFALSNARELCGPLDKRTENIIIRHMWPLTPTPPVYAEAYVVTFADKYCAGRELLFSLSKNYREKFREALKG